MRSGRGRRILILAIFVAGVVGVTAALPTLTERLSGEGQSRPTADTREFTVEDLISIDQLKASFNEDIGKVRIYLLLSPT